jgi:hypothetical protein
MAGLFVDDKTVTNMYAFWQPAGLMALQSAVLIF